MTRNQCLVLQGPSRLGDTEFVRGSFAIGAVLDLNCSGPMIICLHGFDALVHQ